MSKRPAAVTVVAWILILLGGIMLIMDFGSLPGVKKPINFSPISIIQLIYSYLKVTFSVISGIAILKRQNWGRFFYLVCWIISFVIYIINSKPMTNGVIGGSILFLITVFFLFGPNANAYFSGRKLNNLTESG